MAIEWNIPEWLSYSIPTDNPFYQLFGILFIATAGILGSLFVHRIDTISS